MFVKQSNSHGHTYLSFVHKDIKDVIILFKNKNKKYSFNN